MAKPISLWRKITETIQPRDPVPGEMWYPITDGDDPWCDRMQKPVTIIDVKGGWVRFTKGDNSDCRHPLGMFYFAYRRW